MAYYGSKIEMIDPVIRFLFVNFKNPYCGEEKIK